MERMIPMSIDSAPNSDAQKLAPDYMAHWVVKTARSRDMIAWYRTVFGARIVHEGPLLLDHQSAGAATVGD
jgi:hypothetical protein